MQWDNAPCRHSQFPHGRYYRKETKAKPAFANLFCTVTSRWHRIPYQAPVIPTSDPQASVQPQAQQSVCFGHTEGRSRTGFFLLPHKVPDTCPVGRGTSMVTDVLNQFVFFFFLATRTLMSHAESKSWAWSGRRPSLFHNYPDFVPPLFNSRCLYPIIHTDTGKFCCHFFGRA